MAIKNYFVAPSTNGSGACGGVSAASLVLSSVNRWWTACCWTDASRHYASHCFSCKCNRCTRTDLLPC